MKVNIEEVQALKARLLEINLTNLSDIEWFKDGKKLDIAPEVLEEWKFIGLSNVEFISTEFYGTTIIYFDELSGGPQPSSSS